ncbi:2Fe-2S iron-sulfur cluster binding domain-containing protein [Janthinobacterium sp.]|uniref:2Fe-2S iron-sulfur cluster-binding protein n=1 Tax=Janthinobacterium sp. TaxID=1871054 RepID=UPI00293D3D9F|nr:2Fe-2S iron-sulfur cluster binding domain-containing protein [Janthinobacterium sp.]
MSAPFTVTLAPQDWSFEAGAEVSVLQAAEAAGIRLPSSCRNGTCRTCLCRMLEGSVHYRIDWPGLSADEKRAGDILPCVAVADSDLRLAVGGARRRS